MKVSKSDNKLPASIHSKRKMARISISVDHSTPISMEFNPSHSLPWMIQNFIFDTNLEFRVYGTRGGEIPESDLRIDWMSIKWPER